MDLFSRFLLDYSLRYGAMEVQEGRFLAIPQLRLFP